MVYKTSQKILGIDEAGRGCLIGPLVIAGVMTNQETINTFKTLGVTDSKILTPSKREELFKKIQELAERIFYIEVEPEEIDSRFSSLNNLNSLEINKMAEIINQTMPNIAVIDAPMVNTEKFKAIVQKIISHKCEIIAENYADKNHTIVGAASIIAKVIRDQRIREIEQKTGLKVGCGYCHDEETIQFAQKAIEDKNLRKYLRQSWITFLRIKNENSQKKISDWNGRKKD